MFSTSPNKLAHLQQRLSGLGPCLVALSAGVDSTFLLKVAVDVLGRDAVLAVTARSASLASEEAVAAEELARLIGARHRVIDTNELENPDYRANRGDRCYFCKRTLFTAMRGIAQELGARHLLYGAIVDDLSDDRPGHRAAQEFEVLSSLQEAGLTKVEIRELSRELGLPTWNKPQLACLSSRIPRGDEVTVEKLRVVESAEHIVRLAGFHQVRVRHHGAVARIEVEPQDISRLQQLLANGRLVSELHALGFHDVVCDPHGYRTAAAIVQPTTL